LFKNNGWFEYDFLSTVIQRHLLEIFIIINESISSSNCTRVSDGMEKFHQHFNALTLSRQRFPYGFHVLLISHYQEIIKFHHEMFTYPHIARHLLLLEHSAIEKSKEWHYAEESLSPCLGEVNFTSECPHSLQFRRIMRENMCVYHRSHSFAAHSAEICIFLQGERGFGMLMKVLSLRNEWMGWGMEVE
jgi:hypothetical protein